MTIDNSIAIGVVTIASTVVIWAVKSVASLDGRMNVFEVQHKALVLVVDGIKHDVSKGIDEIRQDNREFRAEMQRYNKEFRTEVIDDLRYIKGKVDKVNVAMGDRPLRRDNEDDRATNART